MEASYVAETMSSMSAADDKEMPHRYGSVLLREVCLERLNTDLTFRGPSAAEVIYLCFASPNLARLDSSDENHRSVFPAGLHAC